MRNLRTILLAGTTLASSAGLLLFSGCSDSKSPSAAASSGLDGSADTGGGDSSLSASDGSTAPASEAGDGSAADSSPANASDVAAASDAADGATGVASEAGADANTDASTDASTCPPPPQLHPSQSGAGIACPFSATDGGDQSCATGSAMCCVTPSAAAGASVCQPFGAWCPDPFSSFGVWQCAAPQDCVGAPVDGGGEPLVCCLVSGYAETTNAPGCPTTYKTAGGFASVTCQAASACAGTAAVPAPGSDGGQVYTDYLTVVCEADADCVAAGAGSTCTPIRVSGVPVGVCTLNLR